MRRDSLLNSERFTGVLSNLSQEATNLAMNQVAHDLAVSVVVVVVVVEVSHGRVADVVADAVSRHHPLLVVLGLTVTNGSFNEWQSNRALPLVSQTGYSCC